MEKTIVKEEMLSLHENLNEQIQQASKDTDYLIWQEIVDSDPEKLVPLEKIESECKKLRPEVLPFKTDFLDP